MVGLVLVRFFFFGRAFRRADEKTHMSAPMDGTTLASGGFRTN